MAAAAPRKACQRCCKQSLIITTLRGGLFHGKAAVATVEAAVARYCQQVVFRMGVRASPQNPSSSDIGWEESQGAAFWCGACQKQWERRSPGSFVRVGSTSGSDTRYHARVRPGGVNKECASRLLMWRNASRSFSVEVAAYEPY